MKGKLFLLFFVAYTMFFSCKKNKIDISCEGVSVSYANDIVPIINTNCALSGCHVSGFSSGDYTTYTGLKAKADNGTLKERVVAKKDMPPSTTLGPKSLSDADIKKFFCWIEDGAGKN